MTDLTDHHARAALVEKVCTARWPDLFSDDPVVAHRAATPMDIAPARVKARREVRRIVDLVQSVQQPGEERAIEIIKEWMLAYHDETKHLPRSALWDLRDRIAVIVPHAAGELPKVQGTDD